MRDREQQAQAIEAGYLPHFLLNTTPLQAIGDVFQAFYSTGFQECVSCCFP
jgi:hypothetical protein